MQYHAPARPCPAVSHSPLCNHGPVVSSRTRRFRCCSQCACRVATNPRPVPRVCEFHQPRTRRYCNNFRERTSPVVVLVLCALLPLHILAVTDGGPTTTPMSTEKLPIVARTVRVDFGDLPQPTATTESGKARGAPLDWCVHSPVPAKMKALWSLLTYLPERRAAQSVHGGAPAPCARCATNR